VQKYTDIVLGQNGQTLLPQKGANVTVLTYPGGAIAAIYSDNGITTTANPLTTDVNGRFAFYAANGRYSLLIAYQGVSYNLQDFPLEDDPANGQTTVITGGSIDNTPIGATTPSSGAFTSLSASGNVSGNGFIALFASPPAIGSTTASTGSFTNLTATGTLTGFTGRLINTQTLSATGTYNSTAGTSYVVVDVQAPGGGGGGTPATGAGQSAVAGAGGGGSFARARFATGFTGGVAVTIPAGGAGGAAGANAGTAGSTASFGALISCPGGTAGSAGSAASTITQANGSSVSSAPTITGGTTIVSLQGQGGGPGYVLAGGSIVMSSRGGNSLLGFGGATGSGAAGAGTGFGAGGGGAVQLAASSAAVAGSAGSNAVIVVYEYSV
jgi:hypothetical protein